MEGVRNLVEKNRYPFFFPLGLVLGRGNPYSFFPNEVFIVFLLPLKNSLQHPYLNLLLPKQAQGLKPGGGAGGEQKGLECLPLVLVLGTATQRTVVSC